MNVVSDAGVVDVVWQFFYGTIDRWNKWLEYQEHLQAAQEFAVVPVSVSNHYPSPVPHAPIKTYNEADFAYNLADPAQVKFTGDAQADVFVKEFALLKIDIFKLIRQEQTLPDSKFIKKRYLLRMKEVHPDRTRGTSMESIQLNGAKAGLDHLYSHPGEQIHLFQSVLNKAFEEAKSPKPILSDSAILKEPGTTTTYMVLWLVGGGGGVCLGVCKGKEKNSKEVKTLS